LEPGGFRKILRRYPHPGVCLQQQSTTAVERIRIQQTEYAALKFPSNGQLGADALLRLTWPVVNTVAAVMESCTGPEFWKRFTNFWTLQ